jgi:hypothetical protein
MYNDHKLEGGDQFSALPFNPTVGMGNVPSPLAGSVASAVTERSRKM